MSICQPLMYKDVSFGVDLDTRVALVGPNGVGKTTLLNIIQGSLMPTDGMIKPHSHLKIARYAQHFADSLPMEQTSLDYMMEQYADWLDKQDVPDKRKLMRMWLGRSVYQSVLVLTTIQCSDKLTLKMTFFIL